MLSYDEFKMELLKGVREKGISDDIKNGIV